MKKSVFLLIFLFFGVSTAIAQDSEKQRIIEVVEGEHLAYSARDFDKYMSFVNHSNNILWGDGINRAYKGIDEVRFAWKKFFEAYPNPIEPGVFYDYNISIAGDKAWANFYRKKKGANSPISQESSEYW